MNSIDRPHHIYSLFHRPRNLPHSQLKRATRSISKLRKEQLILPCHLSCGKKRKRIQSQEITRTKLMPLSYCTPVDLKRRTHRILCGSHGGRSIYQCPQPLKRAHRLVASSVKRHFQAFASLPRPSVYVEVSPDIPRIPARCPRGSMQR